MRRLLLISLALAAGTAAPLPEAQARTCPTGLVAVDRNCAHPFGDGTCTAWVWLEGELVCLRR